MNIKIGIRTEGKPILSSLSDGNTLLNNMLIGVGFHWQRSISAILPGEVEVAGPDLMVNTLPIETYLMCVVGSEMNPAAPIEFLKAHAIISRSWAVNQTDILGGKRLDNSQESAKPSRFSIADATFLKRLGSRFSIADATFLKRLGSRFSISWEDGEDHAEDPFDVCNDDHCQRYQGVPENISEQAREAIESTAGMILADADGNPIDARFSKCCGGYTELFSSCWQDIDFPYLPAKPDPYCDLSSLSPAARRALLSTVLKSYDYDEASEQAAWDTWHAEIDKEWLRSRIIDKYGVDLGELQELQPIKRGPSGRIIELKITGKDGEITIGKELAIRRLLATDCLRSSCFYGEATSKSLSKFLIRGRGWGHGVGLCQIGAARMAADGASCEQILSFYYPSAVIKKIKIETTDA